MSLFSRSFGLIFGVLLLAGCGFQLAGSQPLAPELGKTFIETDDTYSEFYRKLARALEVNGVSVVNTASAAQAVLRIRTDETGQRVLSVSAQNVPREFEVYYTVSYELRVNDEIRSGANDLTVTRDYTWSEEQVLGKAREETVLRSALVDELVTIVMRRLAYTE